MKRERKSGGRRRTKRAERAALRLVLHPSAFILDSTYAAIFGAASLTEAIVAPPPVLTPKFTTNSAASPIAVERVAWMEYITLGTPDGTVASTNLRDPVPPTNWYSPASETLR